MRASEFISETTTAGGIATVVAGGMGAPFTRNASIYGNEKKKKKSKKTGKYKNSVTKD